MTNIFFKIFTNNINLYVSPLPPKNWVDCDGMIFFTYSNFLAYQSLPEYKFSENFLVLVKNYEIKSKNY